MQGDSVLTVFPLYVTVSRFLKSRRPEADGDGQLAQPPIDRDVDAVWRRIADHETDAASDGRHASKLPPDASHVQEVRGDHRMIIFFAAVVLPLRLKTGAHAFKLIPNG